MDVLKTGKGRARLLWALALLSWCTAAACLSMSRTREEPSFPHRVHVVDNKLACTFCHGSVRGSDDPGMPPPELCAAFGSVNTWAEAEGERGAPTPGPTPGQDA